MRRLLDYADIYSGFVGYEPDRRAYHYHPPQVCGSHSTRLNDTCLTL